MQAPAPRIDIVDDLKIQTIEHQNSTKNEDHIKEVEENKEWFNDQTVVTLRKQIKKKTKKQKTIENSMSKTNEPVDENITKSKGVEPIETNLPSTRNKQVVENNMLGDATESSGPKMFSFQMTQSSKVQDTPKNPDYEVEPDLDLDEGTEINNFEEVKHRNYDEKTAKNIEKRAKKKVKRKNIHRERPEHTSVSAYNLIKYVCSCI